jgi:hypothetical protein
MPDTSQSRAVPIRYDLRVLGHLDPHWSAWFTGFSLTPQADGTTSMSGFVTDQSELHGLLEKIRDLGATLLSLTLADAPGDRLPCSSTRAQPGAESRANVGADPGHGRGDRAAAHHSGSAVVPPSSAPSQPRISGDQP